MNLLDNPQFIFNCPHSFTERFSGADDFFKPNDDVEPDPIRGLAMRRTNFVPDIVNTELPLDNRRSPGYRRVEPQMANNRFMLDRPHERLVIPRRTSISRLRCRLRQRQGLHLHGRCARHHAVKDGSRQDLVVHYEPSALFHGADAGDCSSAFRCRQGRLRVSAWHGPNNQRARRPGRPASN
jgi:hypothetical protein